MTDLPNYPDSLLLPPEAFDGFSKHLNIFGTEHVCDGEDYVKYVRDDTSRGTGKVKPLTFKRICEGSPYTSVSPWVGLYRIDQSFDGKWYASGPNGFYSGGKKTFEKALKKANADFEKFVKGFWE